ncbi:uncharacterized protein B0I36DRAFT_434500 [Microdochium trichocladiopsis]|uniref:Ankyrin repeat-containing domain protein n=1 Tax=Microdochium trichocladiopsis TaxID=1682393 RepID=A0A9P8Y155_9PEZI|nr:uncharacterized protein B0I36DRAFT_434500 [Microdochium trichocladiopsis]KAH7024936.1 hypothetical protein B0I36DRAFT_434500 [Microdochium trichocladiopsis]
MASTLDSLQPDTAKVSEDLERLRGFVLQASKDNEIATVAEMLCEQHNIEVSLLQDGQLLPERELAELLERFGSDAGNINDEDYASGKLPDIDIEVLEANGRWTSLRTISEKVSTGRSDQAAAAFVPSVKFHELPFQRFEKTVFGDNSTGAQLLKQDPRGIQHVQEDMQRLVLEIQKATNSPRPMDPAALYVYLCSFSRNHHNSTRRTLPKPGAGSSLGFDFGSHILIDKNDMSASTVLRMLLFSVANGFAGLDAIPAESIISHLRQQAHATSLLRNILKLPGHIPRALADNLLKAAVAAKDVPVAKMLLELRPKSTSPSASASINDIRARTSMSSKNAGPRPAPKTLLEQAARSRDADMIALLLSHGADPNQRFSPPATTTDSYDYNPGPSKGPLAVIVGGNPAIGRSMGLGSDRKKEDGYAPAKLLLDAGCTFDPAIVDYAIQRREMELAFLLALHVSPKMHRTMISRGGMLVKLVRYARREIDALEIVERFHYMCSGGGHGAEGSASEAGQAAPCGECPSRYGDSTLTWVVVESCRRRFLSLVDFFTKKHRETYAPHIRWDMALSAAFRTRDSAIIDRILAMEPDIAKCKKHTIDRHTDDFDGRLSMERYSTPLSEAIESGLTADSPYGADYASVCEARGALEALKKDADHRRCALQGAASIGNVAYLDKILDVCKKKIKPADMTDAMAMAILAGHDDAFYTLYRAGGDMTRRTSHSPCAPDPMFAAILRRNLPVARVILASGGGGGSNLSDRYLHSFDFARRDYSHPWQSDEEDPGSSDHPRNTSSDILDQAILWGRRDIIIGVKTLRPMQCLTFPSTRVQVYLRANHDMLDFLVAEHLINTDGLKRCLEHAFFTQDEAFLDKLLAAGADGASEAVLTAGIKAPKLLRRVLEDVSDGRRPRPQKPGFGIEALIGAIRMEDRAVLEARPHNAMRIFEPTESALVNGRQVGREAVAVLLDSGLVDVRCGRYSNSPMKEAIDVYQKRIKEKGGQPQDGAGAGVVDVQGLGAEIPPNGAAGQRHNADDDDYDELEIIRALLARGCHPDDPSRGWRGDSVETSFLHAIGARDPALVQLMLEHGATINYPPASVLTGDGADEDAIDDDPASWSRLNFFSGLSRTPLQRAVEENSAVIVDMLLNPDKYTNSSSSSLPTSRAWEPADANAPASHRGGATALQIAAAQGNCGIAATLLAHGADINAGPAKVLGKSALLGAAENGRLEMVDFLYANGYVFEWEGCKEAYKAAKLNGEMACAARIREILEEVEAGVGGDDEEGVEEVARESRL